ncbi:MAG: hypothetical protein M0Z51_00210, partial [Propionibacterium sp.]|nr:hypothetical protein [Propionibacterium sp.]
MLFAFITASFPQVSDPADADSLHHGTRCERTSVPAHGGFCGRVAHNTVMEFEHGVTPGVRRPHVVYDLGSEPDPLYSFANECPWP